MHKKITWLLISACAALMAGFTACNTLPLPPDSQSSSYSSQSSSYSSFESSIEESTSESSSESSVESSIEESSSEKVRYTIYYELGTKASTAKLDAYQGQVVYGETFTLPTPKNADLTEFLGWYLKVDGNMTTTKVESGVYTYETNITVVAKWKWSSTIG